MSENLKYPPEGILVSKFDDIQGSCYEPEFSGWIRMLSYSISMPNLLTFVTDPDENQVFINAWLKKTVFECATFQQLCPFTNEGLWPVAISEFKNVTVENLNAGVTISHPFEGARVSCSFETCSYKMERPCEGTSRGPASPDSIRWSNRDGKTVHHESRFYENKQLYYVSNWRALDRSMG